MNPRARSCVNQIVLNWQVPVKENAAVTILAAPSAGAPFWAAWQKGGYNVGPDPIAAAVPSIIYNNLIIPSQASFYSFTLDMQDNTQYGGNLVRVLKQNGTYAGGNSMLSNHLKTRAFKIKEVHFYFSTNLINSQTQGGFYENQHSFNLSVTGTDQIGNVTQTNGQILMTEPGALVQVNAAGTVFQTAQVKAKCNFIVGPYSTILIYLPYESIDLPTRMQFTLKLIVERELTLAEYIGAEINAVSYSPETLDLIKNSEGYKENLERYNTHFNKQKILFTPKNLLTK